MRSCGVTVGLSLPVPCMELTTSRIACTSSLLSGAHISLEPCCFCSRQASHKFMLFCRSMTTTMIECAVCLCILVQPSSHPFHHFCSLRNIGRALRNLGTFKFDLFMSDHLDSKTFTYFHPFTWLKERGHFTLESLQKFHHVAASHASVHRSNI